ncbi:MAG: ribose-phosphate pyrophosphokinase [Bradymonadaceae bacterium]
MKPLVLAFPGERLGMAGRLAEELGAELGSWTMRRFPDGESYLRVDSAVKGRDVLVVATMTRPDEQTLPLLFLAETLCELEATSVGWVTPYLPYMRQDTRFHPGEALTSRGYARLLSTYFDWLVTVDPHLHRLDSLDPIYSIPCRLVHSAPRIADWLAREVPDGFLIGPDAESHQWVSAVAALADLPFMILEKVRSGDRDVEVTAPAELSRGKGRRPVIIDDIISTGRTMIETIEEVRRAGLGEPVCIGIHALFVDDSFDELRRAGISRIVTCNTVEHESNTIDITGLLAEGVKKSLALSAAPALSDGVA